MLVKIKPYVNYIGPYQIAEFLIKCLFWKTPSQKEALNDKFNNWIQTKDTKKIDDLCLRIQEVREKGRVKVVIHKYDIWSMDSTLAHIILPMLKLLREDKHGVPFVDDNDVPEELREYDSSSHEHPHLEKMQAKWDWVLDQMIFSFTCKLDPEHNAQFFDFTGTDPKDITSLPSYDKEGLERHEQRVQLGFELFGKYFQNLWT